MSDKRRAILLEDLPEDIVVNQILIRLPSKDVGRCRAVSRSWRSATSTPEFMLEHHRRQPLLPIIDGHGVPTNYAVFGNAGTGASSQQLPPFLPGSQSQTGICASCDGLLILRHRSWLFIYNPIIGGRAVLPVPFYGQGFVNNVIGFYRHDPTEEYRVLLVSQAGTKYSLHILTVGSDESRHVTVTLPEGSSPSVEQKLLNGLRFLRNCPPAVQHRGSLHWCPRGASDMTEGGGDIIAFDTEAESFRWMRSPAEPCSSGKLFNMKGGLGFWGSSTSPGCFTAINVWVMQDYEAGIWDFKYRIDLSTVEASRQLYLTSLKQKSKEKTPLDSTLELFNDMVVLNERELLIMFNKKYVLRCDTDGKFLGIVKIGKSQYGIQLTQYRLQESIIPLPSHVRDAR